MAVSRRLRSNCVVNKHNLLIVYLYCCLHNSKKVKKMNFIRDRPLHIQTYRRRGQLELYIQLVADLYARALPSEDIIKRIIYFNVI